MIKNTQKGFTLIELMIVVAIIGILAAIAIPAYQDYITRSKVTELVTAASACKSSVSEYAQTLGTLPGTLTEAGCNDNTSQYVETFAMNASGAITVTASDAVGGSAIGQDYVLTPTFDASSGTVAWACDDSTIPSKYLPANCR
ncbi:pilin [Flagellatimonas centrodinii]|uniref:pilin n=1 Tax=Flagellatimonas centrodinii TaxID=2806210 RepID=UPI0023BAB746|nr:pilin [Flagellatimonas centrodinii]